MNVLDLRSMRCPLALVTLKRALLSTNEDENSSLKLLFSTESSMLDIILYLDKKFYQYHILNNENFFSLIILNSNKGKNNAKTANRLV
ncbi:MAG: sulfurtransferase TusA family protein [Psychromonas sp.]